MKNMKLYMLCGVLVLGLAACQAQKEPVTPLPTGEAAVEAQASVFQSLRMAKMCIRDRPYPQGSGLPMPQSRRWNGLCG